jgi:hypothetical protein
MKISKSEVALLLGLSTLCSDSSASESKQVRFDPSIDMEYHEMTSTPDDQLSPEQLKLREESRTLQCLSFSGYELYEAKGNAMQMITPGNPWFASDAPCRAAYPEMIH